MAINVARDGRLSIASIVFATDFSSASYHAGLYAAAIARHFQAELVITNSFLLTQGARDAEARTQHASVERRDLEEQLTQTAASLVPSDGRVRTKLLEGDPSETIAVFADSIPDALLIVGTHGGGAVERHLIGSVAERILRTAACPTITVGPRVSEPDRNSVFGCMLYATDCSDMASRAAPVACAMASSFASTLKVISVVSDKDGDLPDLLANLEFDTHQALSSQLDGQCDHFLEPRALAKPTKAREQILKYAGETNTGLIILGVRRRETIEILDRNSVTIQLITEAPCPVLTVTRDSLGIR